MLANLGSREDAVRQLRGGEAHSRSLGCARDDKGEGGASRKNWLVAERITGPPLRLGQEAFSSAVSFDLRRSRSLVTDAEVKRHPPLCHPDPDFLYVAPSITACAAFSEESRMRLANATELRRKSGGRSRGTRCAPLPNATAQMSHCELLRFSLNSRSCGRGCGTGWLPQCGLP